MYDKMMEVNRHKEEVTVQIRCFDGDYFTGCIYLESRQRLSDLMNDTRQFIPVRQENGRMVVVSKSAIKMIEDMSDEAEAVTDEPVMLSSVSS